MKAIKRGMTVVEIRKNGEVVAVLAGREFPEVLWSEDHLWVSLLRSISNGEPLSYFARPTGYSANGQPRIAKVHDEDMADDVLEMIGELGLKEIPITRSRKSILDGAMLVKELKAAKAPQGQKLGSESPPKQLHPSGLEYSLVTKLNSILHRHNLAQAQAKNPTWTQMSIDGTIDLYKRIAAKSAPGIDKNGNPKSISQQAIEKVVEFLDSMASGREGESWMKPYSDLLDPSHPWKRELDKLALSKWTNDAIESVRW